MLYQYRIPPLLLVGIVAFLMYAIKPYVPSFSLPYGIKLILTLALLAMGLIFIILGIANFRMHKTTVNPVKPETSTTLVTSGIFSISRNPMYVGFLFVLFSWGIYLQNTGSLLLIIIFFIYINAVQIPIEEKALSALFGETFQDYQSRVRRWL